MFASVAGVAQPSLAAVVTVDLTFEREFFQDVVDFGSGQQIGVIFDGEPYGFTGTFSDLAVGAPVQASFDVSTDAELTVTDCLFDGAECPSMFAQMNEVLGTLSLSGLGPISILYDFTKMVATYYEDGPGDMTEAGMFSFYGAEFAIVAAAPAAASIEPVPLPASALTLIAGLAGLGALRMRRKG